VSLYKGIVAGSDKLKRGLVWCLVCGRPGSVNGAYALQHGWPKCCEVTMSLDSPEEQNKEN